MNPDTIGCVWTGEFDLNKLRVDGDIFESGKKKLRIQKYPDTCGRGLSMQDLIGIHFHEIRATVLSSLIWPIAIRSCFLFNHFLSFFSLNKPFPNYI